MAPCGTNRLHGRLAICPRLLLRIRDLRGGHRVVQTLVFDDLLPTPCALRMTSRAVPRFASSAATKISVLRNRRCEARQRMKRIARGIRRGRFRRRPFRHGACWRPRITSESACASSIVTGSSGAAMNAVKSPFVAASFGRTSAIACVHVVIRQRLGAIIRETIERRLSREPITTSLLIQIRRTLGQLPQGFAENGKLVARFGASKPKPLTGKPGIWLADQRCRTQKDRPGGTSGRPQLRYPS